MKKSQPYEKLTLTEFQNSYWYAEQVREIAESIGIKRVGQFRKDQLELSILEYLKTGTVVQPVVKRMRSTGTLDVDLGLKLSMPVQNYGINASARKWMLEQAALMERGFRFRSGAWYRINRWVEQNKSNGITYRDVIAEFVRLCNPSTAHEKIPSTRFNNFISDYLQYEKDGTRKQAMDEWEKLKRLKVPKTYAGWKTMR